MFLASLFLSVCLCPQSTGLQIGVMLETTNTYVLKIKLQSLRVSLHYCSAELQAPPQQEGGSWAEVHNWLVSVQENKAASL